jgi:tetratricopeptide (TPR) repeat protein
MALEEIGKYQILGTIGQGAMGVVYKARDPVLNRLVALKTISAILVGDEQFRKRFQREAQSAAQLNHPNVITIYDFEETQAGVYMAMELLDGMDLREAIIHRSLPSLKEKLQLFEQVCDGLAFAHASGVIHRDLKPGNIHILSSGVAKILDFGLARPRASEMTATGTIMGTPHYMSPEQVRGEKADTRSDVFSLGAVFYEVLVGHKPFDASSMHSILFQVLDSEAAPLRQRGVPGPLADVVHTALAKDPERRYADAGRMREALRAARQNLSASDLDITLVLGAGGDATIVETSATAGTSPGLSFPPPSAGRGRSLVTGATALDLDKRLASDPVRTVQPAPTIPGAASRKAKGAAARSPARLLVAAAVAAIGLAAGGLYLKTRWRAADAKITPSDVSSEQVGALTEALVSGQVELAQVDLDNKDYESASLRAEQALKADPANASALQIRTQAKQKLEELNTAVAEARGAIEAADSDRASRALGVVLSIDPRHPAAGQLSAALNRHFQGQAEGARRAARESRAAADLARASSAEGFAEAAKLVTDAEMLFRRQEYAVATQKFLESRDGFERARRAAEAAARVPSPRAVASGGVPTPAMATSQSSPPPTVTTPAPPPPIAAPAAPAPAAPARPAATQSYDAPVRQLIADYGRAIETQNLDLFKTVKPNLSTDEEKRLREAFKSIKSQQVGIAIRAIEVDGSNATVQVTRQDTVNGRAMKPMAQTFRLTRGPGGAWTIQSIGQ